MMQLLEFLALWRIGSKLEQMDRRQAEMNEAYLGGAPWDQTTFDLSHQDGMTQAQAKQARVEPHFDDASYSTYTPPASGGSWNIAKAPAMPDAETQHWMDAAQSKASPAGWREPPSITVEPLALLPPPQTRAKKVTWLVRLARWFAN